MLALSVVPKRATQCWAPVGTLCSFMEATCTSLAWHAQSAGFPRDTLNDTFIDLRLYVLVQIAATFAHLQVRHEVSCCQHWPSSTNAPATRL